MADQTVTVKGESDVAKTAAALAAQLWINEFDNPPKLSDTHYLHLVFLCSVALNGRSVYGKSFDEEVRKVLAGRRA